MDEEEKSLSSGSDDSDGDGDYGHGGSRSMTGDSSAPNSHNTLDNSGGDGTGDEGEAGGEGGGSQGSSRTAMLAMQSPPLETTVSFVGSSDKGVATNRLLAKARLQGASSSLGLKGVLAEVKSSGGGHMPPTRLFAAAALTRRERLDLWRATKATASSINVNTSTRGHTKNFWTSRPNHQTTTTNNNNNSFTRSRAEQKRTNPHGYAANGSSIVDLSSRLTKENSPPSLSLH